MPVRIILTSDLHLDRSFNFATPERALQRMEEINGNFHAIVESALEDKPDLFLIAGDVFNRQKPDNYARVFLTEEIRALNDSGIRVILIGGNHEISRQDKSIPLAIDTLQSAGIATVFSRSDKIESLDLTIRGEKVRISGKSYNGQDEGENPFKGENTSMDADINILMLHASLKGLDVMPNYPDMASSNPFSPEDIPRGLDLLALGHFHKSFDRIYNGTLICNPGSVERLQFDEIEDKKGYYSIVLGEDKPNFEFNELPMRPMQERVLTVDASNDRRLVNQVADFLKSQADPQKIFKLHLKGSIPETRFSEIRQDLIYQEARSLFFNLDVDMTGLVFEGITPFSVTEFEEPLIAFTRHMEKLETLAPSPEEKEIISEAKELGRKYLMEASTA